jgi:prepilin-type processing-associated H-X9-DG protein/prepilin-type N-terminal cleavage/methylation domain-containing protein
MNAKNETVWRLSMNIDKRTGARPHGVYVAVSAGCYGTVMFSVNRSGGRATPRMSNGFTLLELLTVVAVLAILVSLAAPAILSTKQKAKNAQCVQNARQQALALASFVSENHVYPLQSNGRNFRQGRYLEHNRTWMNALFPKEVEQFDGRKNSGVFDCPAVRRPGGFPPDAGFADYGYNSNGMIGGPSDSNLGLGGMGSEGDGFAPPVKESEVRQPSSMIAIGDGLRGWNATIQDGLAVVGRIFTAVDSAGSTARTHRRHRGKANFSFCDGHVETLKLSFLFSDTSEKALRMWNRDGGAHRERLK